MPESALTATTSARRANITFFAMFGNTWNTLPSGHAAGAAAVAVLVWRSGSPLAPVFALLAVGIAIGTVRGRYHYTVDTILGVVLGVIAGITV
jgi:membrane-associated phospholipid phosphatase